MIELYAKLKCNKGYTRHPCSLFRLLRKLGYFKKVTKEKKKYIPKPYNTPLNIGMKWQLDVKHVPKCCYVGQLPDKFYQYTLIDEASREHLNITIKLKEAIAMIMNVFTSIYLFIISMI